MIADWISDEDLKQPEVMKEWAALDRSWRRLWPIAVWGTKPLPENIVGVSRVAALLLWLGPAKLAQARS